MTENFSNHPPSIGEIKSDKSGSALDWTPRDALIWMLREIDAGRIDCYHLILSWTQIVSPPSPEYSKYKTDFRQAGGSEYTWDSLGLLMHVQTLIQKRLG